MKFWDSSALVPLLVREESTTSLQALHRADPQLLVWWGSEVECSSALARREREGSLSREASAEAFDRLQVLSRDWHEIQPVTEVREIAVRFVRVHDLRAADALQLAAAFVAAEGRPTTLEIVSLDGRLVDAARLEGFAMVDLPEGF